MGFKIPEAPLDTLESGTWTEYQGSQFKIAHAGNIRFQRAKQRLEKPYKRDIENDRLDPEKQRAILIKAIAEAVLVDWKGLDGNTPYSVKAAEQALSYDEEFREFVMNFSLDLENFKNQEREHEGNS